MTRAASVRGDPPRLQEPHDSLSAVSRAVSGFGESVFYYSCDAAHAYLPACVHGTRAEIAIDFGGLQCPVPLCSVVCVEREGFETGVGGQARGLHLEEVRGALDAFGELLQEIVPLSAEELGRRLVNSAADIPQVLGVSVTALRRAFQICTVIHEYDMDVCERVFAAESELYEDYPDLEADFQLLTREERQAKLVLTGIGYDFAWQRQQG